VDVESALRELAFENGAFPRDEADLRLAHRRMVKVWHPDRFQNDPDLVAVATSRLAAINRAFDVLVVDLKRIDTAPDADARPKPEPAAPTTDQRTSRARTPSASASSRRPQARDHVPPGPGSSAFAGDASRVAQRVVKPRGSTFTNHGAVGATGAKESSTPSAAAVKASPVRRSLSKQLVGWLMPFVFGLTTNAGILFFGSLLKPSKAAEWVAIPVALLSIATGWIVTRSVIRWVRS
jgi:hypothetical protein